jgi:hypothetical protein
VKELSLHQNRDSVLRWFRELQFYGFTAMVSPAHHGVNGHGKAPHWRLTEEPYLGHAPTKDFLKWDGELFHEQKSPEHYQRKTEAEVRTYVPPWYGRAYQLPPNPNPKCQKVVRTGVPYPATALVRTGVP